MRVLENLGRAEPLDGLALERVAFPDGGRVGRELLVFEHEVAAAAQLLPELPQAAPAAAPEVFEGADRQVGGRKEERGGATAPASPAQAASGGGGGDGRRRAADAWGMRGER